MELVLQIVCLIGCGCLVGLLPALRVGYDVPENAGILFSCYAIVGMMISAYPIFY